jgi:hypothetical protein
MIFDILYLIGGTLLNGIATIFGTLLPFTIPVNFFSGITAGLASISYLGGIINLPVLFQCMFWVVVFEILWITLMLVWYVIGLFRSLISVGGTSGHGS